MTKRDTYKAINMNMCILDNVNNLLKPIKGWFHLPHIQSRSISLKSCSVHYTKPDSVTFTEKILNGKLHFCAVILIKQSKIYESSEKIDKKTDRAF